MTDNCMAEDVKSRIRTILLDNGGLDADGNLQCCNGQRPFTPGSGGVDRCCGWVQTWSSPCCLVNGQAATGITIPDSSILQNIEITATSPAPADIQIRFVRCDNPLQVVLGPETIPAGATTATFAYGTQSLNGVCVQPQIVSGLPAGAECWRATIEATGMHI